MAASRHIDTHPKRPQDGHGGPNRLQVGWVMYTVGLLAFPVGLVLPLPAGRLRQVVSRGPGSRGVGFSVSLRLCGAGFKFLVAGVQRVVVVLSHHCGRVSFSSGLFGLDQR